MKINRVFTEAGKDPFSYFEYENYDCKLTHRKTGEVLLDMPGCVVPKHWAINARDTAIRMYFRKAGVPVQLRPAEPPYACTDIPSWLIPFEAASDETAGETDIKQVVHRIVGHWTFTGYNEEYFEPDVDQLPYPISVVGKVDPDKVIEAIREENALAFYDEMVYIIIGQLAAPNSPQWFNTGLSWAYGIQGKPQGTYYVALPANTTPVTDLSANCCSPINDIRHGSLFDARNRLRNGGCVKESPDNYTRVQAHACFILSLKDNMMGDGGIADWYTREARIFKGGSGSGVNVSNLRGADEPLSSGGVASGPMGFVQTADRSAGAIKSGGTTRRAAKMVVMNADHPDALEFVTCKAESELMVAAMLCGSKHVNERCQQIVSLACDYLTEPDADQKSKFGADLRAECDLARASHVPQNYIRKALLLAEQGELYWPQLDIDEDLDGLAYGTVAYQNANNALRITDEFLAAAKRKDVWILHPRTRGGHKQECKAEELLWSMAKSLWHSGDPGTQYDTTINAWNTTPADGRINASNPCSEFMHLDDTACNLASLKLTACMNEGKFDANALLHVTRLLCITLDLTNSMVHLPDLSTAINTYLFRNIGVGYCDLGGLVMSYAQPYDSDGGRAIGAYVSALMQGQLILTSAELAKSLGTYPRYDQNRSDHLRVIRNHMAATGLFHMDFQELNVIPPILDHTALEAAFCHETDQLRETLREVWSKAESMAIHHGQRNAQLSAIAPTGTIGLVLGADTTGVEPNFSLLSFKKLVGGGSMALSPLAAIKAALKRLDYSAQQIDMFMPFIAEHGHMPTARDINTTFFTLDYDLNIFRTAMGSGPGDPPIDWQGHVAMMAAVQPFISGAISKTVNMPETATIADMIEAIYTAHKSGVKALALYRDNSKLCQPLNVKRDGDELPILAFADPQPKTLNDVIDMSVPVSKPTPLYVVEPATEPAPKLTITAINTAFAALDEVDKKRAVKAKPVSPPIIESRVRLGWDREPGFDVAVRLHPGTLYLRTTRYDDGRCAEIWATYTGAGDREQSWLSSLCRLANISLQYGVPLQAIIDSWKDSNFAPQGLVGDHPYIKTAKSVINLIARLLEYHEQGNTCSLNIQPSMPAMNADDELKVTEAIIELSEGDLPEARLSGLSCAECGSAKYVQSGAGCMKCLDCGFAGGCG